MYILISNFVLTKCSAVLEHEYIAPPQVSQSRFNPKRAPMEDLGDVLKPNIEPKLDEYHWYFF